MISAMPRFANAVDDREAEATIVAPGRVFFTGGRP